MTQAPHVDRSTVEAPPEPAGTDRDGRDRLRLPGVRIGVASGVAAILCCVGPAALALLGIISGATAFTLATDLYRDWAWGFRLLGLAVAAALVRWSLRRRDSCDADGFKRSWRSLAVIAVVGAVSYGVLYAVTTWLGTFA
ncbi:MAG: hypothetical protein ACRDUY_07630 [Nitriliruptorales bacterium]